MKTLLKNLFFKYSKFEMILFAMTFVAMCLYFFGAQFYAKSENQIGVTSGRFCGNVNYGSGEETFDLILKSFHIAPVFLSRCLSGSLGLDSDQDGMCDKDEDDLGYDKNNAFSKSRYISDRVYHELTTRNLPSQIESQNCGDVDSDSDLLYDCEEILLRPSRYQGADLEQTQKLWNQQGLKSYHPDTDEDGYIDGIEFRLVNGESPFVHQNTEIDKNAEILLKRWVSSPEEDGVDMTIQSYGEICYSYKLSGIDQWFAGLDDFDQLKDLAQSRGELNLDFIVYALFSTEESPTRSAYYGAKIINVTFDGNRIIDNKMNEFTLTKIEGIE
jgi:hypothetical protein